MPQNPNRLDEQDVLRIVERLGGQAEAADILREYEAQEIATSAVMFAIQRALDSGRLRLNREMQIVAPKNVEAA